MPERKYPHFHNPEDFLGSNPRRGLAIDLDETTSFTLKTWFQELVSRFGNSENLTAKQIFARYGYLQNYWTNPEARQHMDQMIVDNEMHKTFDPIHGAKTVLRQINKIVSVSLYLTNRPCCVVPGTQEWLAKHGFPKAPIIARPENVDYKNGSEWKAGVLRKLYPTVIGIIDDSTSLHKFLNGYPGIIFWFHESATQNILQISDSPKIIECRRWRDIKDNIMSII